MAQKKSKTAVKTDGSRARVSDFGIMRAPVITEKSARSSEERTVVFRVDPRASKDDVRTAVERIFSVKIEAVRTCSYMGKPKRVSKSFGRRDGYKKAYVKLKEGFSIDLVEGL